MTGETGVLPDFEIKEMIEAGFIKNGIIGRINPASLDLPITKKIFRLSSISLPHVNERIEDLLKESDAQPHDLKNPLEKGVNYLAKLEPELELPEGVFASFNSKSTTGRNTMFVRVLADGIPRFDKIPLPNFKGQLWAVINSPFFPLKICAGDCFTQLRLIYGNAELDTLKLKILLEKEKILWSSKGKALKHKSLVTDEGLLMLTAEVKEGLVGWEALESDSDKVLDLEKEYLPQNFFRHLESKERRIELQKNHFYLLYTYERIRMPPNFCGELKAIDPTLGEIRIHAAGWWDPGWGYGEKGEGKGRKAVLEVIPYQDFALRHAQPIATMAIARMRNKPEHHYEDKQTCSHYTEESKLPPLSRNFIQE